MKLTPFLTFTFILAAVPAMAQRGMPSENRDTIHQLLAAHGKIKREVIVTYDGYTSSTKSTDKDVVAALQRHVNQMEARMKKGLMVRRWDPAYVEFIEHYDDINLKTQKTDDGVRVVAKRSTEESGSQSCWDHLEASPQRHGRGPQSPCRCTGCSNRSRSHREEMLPKHGRDGASTL